MNPYPETEKTTSIKLEIKNAITHIINILNAIILLVPIHFPVQGQ